MRIASVLSRGGALLCGLGCVMVTIAILQRGTLAAGIAASVALVIASCGFGTVISFACGQRERLGPTIVSGLAFIVVVSTLLSLIGALSVAAQMSLVTVGIAACLIHCQGAAAPASRAQLAFVVIAGVGLLIVAFLRADVVITGGVNHAFSIKRQWDTGSFGSIHHQLGAQLAGESYVSLAYGAHAVGAYESAITCTLLLLTVATAIDPRADGNVHGMFFIVGVAITLGAAASAQWSGALFHVAAFVTLDRAIAQRRVAVHTVICALAMTFSRHELILIAVPYMAAAFVLPGSQQLSRRMRGSALAIWLVLVVALQVGFAVPWWRAIINAGVILAAVPITSVIQPAITNDGPRSALGVLSFAAVSFAIAVGIEAIGPLQHESPANYAVWLGGGLAILTSTTGCRPGDRVKPVAGYLVGLLLVGFLVVEPTLDRHERYQYFRRFDDALYALEQHDVLGNRFEPHANVLALQGLIPQGARLGFFGQNAAALDFRRNKIRDVSWELGRSRRDERFLTPLVEGSLRGIDHIIVEGVAARNVETPLSWDTSGPRSIADVAHLLTRRACAGEACLFDVRR